MIDILGVLCGVAIVTGPLLVVAGWRQAPPERPPVGGVGVVRRCWGWLCGLGVDPQQTTRWASWRWPTALAAALLAWLLSGWPVAGPIVATGVVGVPALLRSGRSAQQAIDQAEAIQEWTRRLADVLLTGVGLEQAVAATVATCPEPVRGQVATLASRLTARWPTETAVRAFADDLDDAAADLIVATVILGARRRGPGLARVLTAVADSLAEEVAMRRKVEAERAKPRTTARAVTVVIVGVLLLGAVNGDYASPYGTPAGQLMLAGLAAGAVVALVVMHRLAQSAPVPRLLAARASNEFATPAGTGESRW